MYPRGASTRVYVSCKSLKICPQAEVEAHLSRLRVGGRGCDVLVVADGSVSVLHVVIALDRITIVILSCVSVIKGVLIETHLFGGGGRGRRSG